MLKETETEETIGFFVTFLSLVTFQLRERRRPPSWLRQWTGEYCRTYSKEIISNIPNQKDGPTNKAVTNKFYAAALALHFRCEKIQVTLYCICRFALAK